MLYCIRHKWIIYIPKNNLDSGDQKLPPKNIIATLFFPKYAGIPITITPKTTLHEPNIANNDCCPELQFLPFV